MEPYVLMNLRTLLTSSPARLPKACLLGIFDKIRTTRLHRSPDRSGQGRLTSMACVQRPQVHVPPELPEILKQFTKAAIKAQPPDVLAWSAAYFRALATGEAKSPCVKDNELTPALLRVLNKQLGPLKSVHHTILRSKWTGLALPMGQLDRLLKKGDFADNPDVHWIEFFGYACFSMADDLTDAMRIVCICLTSDIDGKIPFSVFVPIYKHLAITLGLARNPIHVMDVICYLEAKYVREQGGYIMPKNFMKDGSGCPKMDA